MGFKKFTIYYFIILFFISCNDSRKESLQNSNSLYIQQHANDPVNWHIWSDNIFEKAKKENKLVLISIGYSACHWCHIMQNESFKNKKIAEIMNNNYYCVKIDKQEHPNLNAYYAKLQESLTNWAGWPMHFILNNKKEVIWTGIYLKPKKWKNLIQKIAEEYKQNPNIKFIATNKLVQKKLKNRALNIDSINNLLELELDTINGGLIPVRYSRKYPITSLFNYLLKINEEDRNKKLRNFLKLTANKMTMGGINDQIEGGFFRFSMDKIWHIPHFEKMLYTNTNLINFYVNSFKTFKDSTYLLTAEKTANFIIKNLKSKNILFFGSMDADQISEGSYYMFSKKEIQNYLRADFYFAKKYYNIYKTWKLKNNKYHLYCSLSDSLFAKENNLSIYEWNKIKKRINNKLLKLRSNKTKAIIDTKLISSWNALLLESFVNIYKINKNKLYYTEAQSIANFLVNKFNEDKTIKHFYLVNKTTKANTYAEDLLYTTKALCKLYSLDKSKKEYINMALKIFKKYLSEKDNLLLFPFDDRNMPSANSVELFIVNYFNNEIKTNFSYPTLDISKINEHPEFYGNTLLEYHNLEHNSNLISKLSK